MDGKSLGSVPLAPNFESVDIERDIKILNDLAQGLRAKRYQTGYLSLDSLRLAFSLNEHGLPTDTAPYARTESNKLIEEVSPSLAVIMLY